MWKALSYMIGNGLAGWFHFLLYHLRGFMAPLKGDKMAFRKKVVLVLLLTVYTRVANGGLLLHITSLSILSFLLHDNFSKVSAREKDTQEGCLVQPA